MGCGTSTDGGTDGRHAAPRRVYEVQPKGTQSQQPAATTPTVHSAAAGVEADGAAKSSPPHPAAVRANSNRPSSGRSATRNSKTSRRNSPQQVQEPHSSSSPGSSVPRDGDGAVEPTGPLDTTGRTNSSREGGIHSPRSASAASVVVDPVQSPSHTPKSNNIIPGGPGSRGSPTPPNGRRPAPPADAATPHDANVAITQPAAIAPTVAAPAYYHYNPQAAQGRVEVVGAGSTSADSTGQFITNGNTTDASTNDAAGTPSPYGRFVHGPTREPDPCYERATWSLRETLGDENMPMVDFVGEGNLAVVYEDAKPTRS